MYAQPILDSRQVVEGHCGSLLQPQINGGGACTATSLGQVQRKPDHDQWSEAPEICQIKKSDQISLKELIPTVPKKASGILLIYRIIGGSGDI